MGELEWVIDGLQNSSANLLGESNSCSKQVFYYFSPPIPGLVFLGRFLVNGRRCFSAADNIFSLFFLAIPLTRKEHLTVCNAPDGLV